jgi:hypothetical protein
MAAQHAQQPGNRVLKGIAAGIAVLCAVALLAVLTLLLMARETAAPAPPINPAQPTDTQLNYPYKLVAGDPRLNFPTAEGRQLDMDSDTWFLEGVLEGQQTGRRYSFIVVYFVSRIYGVIPFNFYSLTFYDLDKADYGTFTKYDVARMKASTGFLDLSLPVNGEHASWTTTVDNTGYLVPFSYSINLPGVDQHGRAMHLSANVKMVNPPVAVGADTYKGLITVLKQPNTYSYFQTGAKFDGVLSWGDHSEPVKGHLGHMDRQMFPRFSGAYNGRDGRDLSHEWRTFFLDNGTDFSSWRQFDRTAKNAEYSYGGATTYNPAQGPRYAGDIVYENLSYVRTENPPIQPLVTPRSNVLYFPNRHRLSSKSLDLELEADPIINAPLLAFPVEYMHGPVMLSGTQAGQPVKGIGSFELTLHLYRDFELVTVLSDSVRHLPPESVSPTAAPIKDILGNIAQVGNAVDRGDYAAARSTADSTVREQLLSLAEPYRGEMLQILNDLIAVL